MQSNYAAVQEEIIIPDTNPCFVPAMDVLISDPEIVSPHSDRPKKADHLYIPIQYLDKLDKFCSDSYQSDRSIAARSLARYFREMIASIHYQGDPNRPFYTCDNGTKVGFYRTKADKLGSSRQSAITLAQELKIVSESSKCKTHNEVKIMTCEDLMTCRAYEANIETVGMKPETYTGHRKVILPREAVGLWRTKSPRITANRWDDIFGQKELPLHPNEYVEFIYEDGDMPSDFKNIGRFDVFSGDSGAIVPLKHLRLKPPYHVIRPMNTFQAMLMESAMCEPDKIKAVIVDAPAGAGKTFFAALAGLYGNGYCRGKVSADPGAGDDDVASQLYYPKGVLVVPRDGGPGKDIGFLKGDSREKTKPKAGAVEEAVRNIVDLISEDDPDPIPTENELSRKTGKKARKLVGVNYNKADYALEHIFNFVPLINIPGSSPKETLIIGDEAQYYEIFQARLLATRGDGGAKVIFTGNTTQQYAARRPGLEHNGLTHLISALKNNEYTSILTERRYDIVVRDIATQAIVRDLGMY